MSRYLFNFIGSDGKTFSDSLEQREYHTPDIIQRMKDGPAPKPEPYGAVVAVSSEVENYRQKRYRGPKHRSLDRDSVWYVHSAISDERALEIQASGISSCSPLVSILRAGF